MAFLHKIGKKECFKESKCNDENEFVQTFNKQAITTQMQIFEKSLKGNITTVIKIKNKVSKEAVRASKTIPNHEYVLTKY